MFAWIHVHERYFFAACAGAYALAALQGGLIGPSSGVEAVLFTAGAGLLGSLMLYAVVGFHIAFNPYFRSRSRHVCCGFFLLAGAALGAVALLVHPLGYLDDCPGNTVAALHFGVALTAYLIWKRHGAGSPPKPRRG